MAGGSIPGLVPEWAHLPYIHDISDCRLAYSFPPFNYHNLYIYINISLSGSEALEPLTDSKSCVTDVFTWMTNSKLLKRNPSKTEFIIIGSKKQRKKFKDLFPILLFDHDTLPKAFVRNFRFIFYCDFNFKRQIFQTCKICFYHIGDFWRIRKYLSLEAAKSVACALVTSHLDYCNSLLYNLPDGTLKDCSGYKIVWHVCSL